MKKSVSIVVPAYNVEGTLEDDVLIVDKIAKELFDDYEILIFDDYSMDKTGEIADRLEKKNPRIRVFHNNKNMNLGYNFRMGVKNATKNYVALFISFDVLSEDIIKLMLSKVGEEPIVSFYISNPKSRHIIRKVISYLVTKIFNLMFGLHLRYYFGFSAFESKLAKKAKMTTNSFAATAELLIRLIKQGHPYKEFPHHLYIDKKIITSVFRLKNIIGIFFVIIRLFFEMNFSNQK